MVNGYRVLERGSGKMFSNYVVVIVVELCEYTKTH